MAEFGTDRVVWRRSTASGNQGDDCVEVAFIREAVLVRHSKDPAGPTLRFSLREWAAFVAGVRNGELSLDPPGQGYS